MAKLRTAEELDDAITQEIAWRKQELTTARKQVQQSDGTALKASLRAGVLILYAHWEGWIKAVSRLYVRFVSTQKHTYEELSQAFLGNALKTRVTELMDDRSPTSHNRFAHFVRTDMGGRARLSEELVQTNSNLSSVTFIAILERLGLPVRSEVATRSQLIDTELVHRRNTIAHGQFLEIDRAEFLALHSNVLVLLDHFTDDIRNAATTKSYLLEK